MPTKQTKHTKQRFVRAIFTDIFGSKMAPELRWNVGISIFQALHAARIKDVSVIDALTSIGGLVKNKAGPWVG